MPVKIPTWDTSHLADERYEIAPGICTRCPTMNWDLYRESPVIAELLYTGGYILAAPPIKGKSFLVWNLDHAEQELWKQPPPEPGMEGKPRRIGAVCSAGYASQSAEQAPECKRRPIAGGKQRGNNSLSPGTSRFVTHRLKQRVSALHFPPKRWQNVQPQKEILQSMVFGNSAPSKQSAGSERVY